MSNFFTIYGVRTSDDEMHTSFKAFTETRELAVNELKNHEDFMCSHSPQPDENHIVPIQVIANETEQNEKEFVLFGIEKRTFIILTEDQVDSTGMMLIKNPLTVHGFIWVYGERYEDSYIHYLNISYEAGFKIEWLCSLAQKKAFNKLE